MFKVGDQVNVTPPVGHPFWDIFPKDRGPYTITRVNKDCVEVKDIDNNNRIVFLEELSHVEHNVTPSEDALKLLAVLNKEDTTEEQWSSIIDALEVLGWEPEVAVWKLVKINNEEQNEDE